MSPVTLIKHTQKENLFKELGLLPLPDHQKIELLEKLTTLLESRFQLTIAKELAKKTTDEKDISNLTEEQLSSYLDTHLPEWPNLLEQEIITLRQELLDDVINDSELQ